MAPKDDAKDFINETINQHKIAVFSKSYCPFCTMAKTALKAVTSDFYVVEIENNPNCDAIQDVLLDMTGGRTVPRVFINQKFVGGGSEVKALKESGKLARLVAA